MTRQEARYAALRAFGGLDQVKEQCRDGSRRLPLAGFLRDVGYALRGLKAHPLYTISSITLVTGAIGLACSAFAVLHGAVLAKLPVPDPDQLVLISAVKPPLRTDSHTSIFDALGHERQHISHMFGIRSTRLQGTVGGVTRDYGVSGILGDYFGALGAVPQLGRFFQPGEKGAVAVISNGFWQREFASAPDVIGRTLMLGLTQIPIVAVASPEFRGIEPYASWNVIMPWDSFQRIRAEPPSGSLELIARLKPGSTASEYEAQLNTLWPSILRSTIRPGMTLDVWIEERGARLRVNSLSRGLNYVFEIQPGIPRAVKMTFLLSVFIFCAGCLTQALLSVARAIRNQHQTAIMLAIGGSRARVLRPRLIEALTVSVIGCIGGLLIALWWSALGSSFLPGSGTLDWRVTIDANVVILAILMACVMSVISGMIASLIASRTPVGRILQSGGLDFHPHVRLHMCLLTLQLATSVLLLHHALLYVGDLSRLSRIPLGFETENLHFYTLNGKLPRRDLDGSYFLELTEQVRCLPGVEAAALTGHAPPLSYPHTLTRSVRTDDLREVQVSRIGVSPGYFDALRLPLLSGRDFSWNDLSSVIVTASLARRMYPDGNPLEHAITMEGSDRSLRIIGVVGDVAYNGPRLGKSPTMFVPFTELVNPWPSNYGVHIAVRSGRALDDLREDVQSRVARLGVHYVNRATDQAGYLSASLQQERMLATFSGM